MPSYFYTTNKTHSLCRSFLLSCLLPFLLLTNLHAEESKEMADKSETMMAEKSESMMMADSKKEGMMNEDKGMADNDMASMSDNNKDTKKIKPPADLYQQYQRDLKHYFANTEELLVGTETISTLLSESNTANNKGVVILLPDWQQPAINPKSIAFLHNTMPDHGWATITIPPFNKPQNYPSIALEEETRKESDKKAIEAYQTKVASVCRVVLEKASAMPGLILFISEGNNAGIVMNIVNTPGMLKPNAMVLLSAYQETPAENMNFAQQLAMTDIPVLDLYLKQDNIKVKPSALLRKKQTEKELKVVYRQKQINNFTPSYYPEKALLKEIQGWLKTIGW